PERPPIGSLRGLVEATARSVCNGDLRARAPNRASLADSLRHLLGARTGQEGFALWEDARDRVRLCGFAEWRGRPADYARSSALHTIAGTVSGNDTPRRTRTGGPHPELVAAILRAAGGPMRFHDLVTAAAELLDVRDAPTLPAEPPNAESVYD